MMWAVATNDNCSYDELDFWQIPAPRPDAGEVLIRVLAAGIDNTESNTRLGWYFASVTGSTGDLLAEQQDKAEQKADGA